MPAKSFWQLCACTTFGRVPAPMRRGAKTQSAASKCWKVTWICPRTIWMTGLRNSFSVEKASQHLCRAPESCEPAGSVDVPRCQERCEARLKLYNGHHDDAPAHMHLIYLISDRTGQSNWMNTATEQRSAIPGWLMESKGQTRSFSQPLRLQLTKPWRTEELARAVLLLWTDSTLENQRCWTYQHNQIWWNVRFVIAP